MNAKGLTVEQLIEYHKSCLPELYFMIQWNQPDEYPPKENLEHQAKFIEATIAALSATIPRETAKCNPMLDDTIESESGRRDVLVYSSKDGEWQTVDYICVSMYPKAYAQWLPMPAAPEATT